MRNPSAIATLPRAASESAEGCPVLGALTIVGDFWTLGVLRCAFKGFSRFGEIQRELGVATNVLSDRLSHLVAVGILDRIPAVPGSARHRYVLTPVGEGLGPVLLALRQWGDRHVLPNGSREVWRHAGCAHPAVVDVRCPDCGDVLGLADLEVASPDRARA